MKVICDVSVSKTPNNWKSQIIKSFLKMRVVEASWEAVAFSGWQGVGGWGSPLQPARSPGLTTVAPGPFARWTLAESECFLRPSMSSAQTEGPSLGGGPLSTDEGRRGAH